jgi:nucleoside-diphosphate-sugar epimerase
MPIDKVVVVGATGNIGTSVVRALADDAAVRSIVGVARRRPEWQPAKTTWRTCDVGSADDAVLGEIVSGADAVVHLAWLFQPTHAPVTTWTANVEGSERVFAAAVRAGVPTLVYSSSVGAYSPGPHTRGAPDEPVDETWPTDGWPQAAYTREKAYVERVLDALEARHPELRVVRLRPAFVFKRAAAQEQRRLFAGPFVPGRLVRPGTVPVVPDLPGLRFQAVHSADLGQAFRLAVTGQARGAFNIAADGVLDARALAECLHARVVRLPAPLVRAAVTALWRMHIVPASPDLLDAVLRLPLMDTARARTELGWQPQHTARQAIEEFLLGLRSGAGLPTPPLAARVPGGRAAELATGVGEQPGPAL